MAEKCECSREGEFKHLNATIDEIKATAKEDMKENTQEMFGMRDSKIRTEFKLEEIQRAQIEFNNNLALMMTAIQNIKNEPFLKWEKLSWIWKTAVIAAVANYIAGNVLGWFKALKLI